MSRYMHASMNMTHEDHTNVYMNYFTLGFPILRLIEELNESSSNTHTPHSILTANIYIHILQHSVMVCIKKLLCHITHSTVLYSDLSPIIEVSANLVGDDPKVQYTHVGSDTKLIILVCFVRFARYTL